MKTTCNRSQSIQTETRTPSDALHRRSRTRWGFTLFETFVAIALLVIVVTATVINFGSLRAGRSFDSAIEQFSTTLRMARVDAANRGTRIRLSFDNAPNPVTVLWEPNPLKDPNVFDELKATWTGRLVANQLVIDQAELTGPDADIAWQTTGGDMRSAFEDTDLPTITFYADGTCDSARFELSSPDPDELREAIVTIDGVTGRVTSRFVITDPTY